MTIEREALALFREVVDQPPPVRAARLAQVPSEVADRVARLLEVDAEASPLDQPILEGAAVWLAEDLAEELPAPEDLPLPERIGAFRIEGLLGHGGMGLVYAAVQDHPRRQVALKVLRPELRRREARRFRAEADALAALVHPAIPQVFDAGVDDGIPWMAMERVEGVPLDRWARAATPLQRLDLLRGVCRAVAAAHTLGLVHRDLKPANVLVTPAGTPRVMDFGLAARGADDATLRAGTPGWMSPEAERGERTALLPTADVYSLGRIIEALLLGDGGGAPQGPPPRRLGWPRSADLPALLARATHARPTARYPDAGALADDLDRLREGRPVQARRYRPGGRLARGVWRHRARTAVAVGVVALLGSAVGARNLIARQQAAATERMAEERLSALKPQIAALVEAGERREARAVLEAATDLSGVRETKAAARAWLDLASALAAQRATGLDATEGDEEERRALAEAFFATGLQDEVLLALARYHLRQLDGGDLGLVLELLQHGDEAGALVSAWGGWSGTWRWRGRRRGPPVRCYRR